METATNEKQKTRVVRMVAKNENAEICKVLMKKHGCKTLKELCLFYAASYSIEDYETIKKGVKEVA